MPATPLQLPALPARRICLIRHGETTANRDRIIAGRLDVPLTDHGRGQARALAELSWDRPVALFCSPMVRARETAALAFPDHQATPVADLRERDWGCYEGRPLAELPPRDNTPDGGEAWREMILRVHRAIASCCALSASALPVLICHSGVIRATRLLAGQGGVGHRPPNACPLFFSPDDEAHEDHGDHIG